mgnify:CR=1 FL=1
MAEVITFHGFDEMISVFDTMDKKLRRTAVKKILEVAAAPIAQMAEGIARTNSFDTGELADSITHTKMKLKGGRFSVSIGPGFDSDLNYAFFVETGHMIGARKGNVKRKVITDPKRLTKQSVIVKDTRTVTVQPEPFLRPAMDAHREDFAERVRVGVEEVFNEFVLGKGRS